MEEITNKEVREKLKKLMEAPPSSPYEVTRKFLSIYFGDADGWDEAIQNIKQFISQRPDVIAKDLQGVDLFLRNSSQEGVLSNLVAWEANWVLDDPSDNGAKEWLTKVAETMREILGDKAPPRP